MRLFTKVGALAVGAILLVGCVGEAKAQAVGPVDQPATVAMKTVRQTVKVGLSTGVKRVTSGKKIKLTASLKTRSGKAVKGAKIYLQRRSFSSKAWQTISVQRTNSRGRIYRVITNNVNYQYRAVAAQSAKNHRAVSSYKSVTARQWLKVGKEYCTYSDGGMTWVSDRCGWAGSEYIKFKVSPGLEGQRLKLQSWTRWICDDEVNPYNYPDKFVTNRTVKVKNGSVTVAVTHGADCIIGDFRVIWTGTKSREAVAYYTTF